MSQSEHLMAGALPAVLARIVAENADMPAIKTLSGLVTYRDLEERSARLAKALLAAGAGKGTRVALLAPNGALFVEGFLACTRIGSLCVPLSTLSAPAELAHVLRHCDAQFLIGVRSFGSRDYGEILAKALPSLASAVAGALRLVEAPFLRAIWLDEASGLSWAGALADFASDTGNPSFSDALLNACEAEVAPADDAVIIYTSGSTALPKAVLHTQGAVARHAHALAELMELRRGERVLPLMPMFWVGGMTIMLEALSQGCCLVFPDKPSPASVVEVLERFGADFVYGWPALRNPVRALAEARGLDYSGVRHLAEWRDADGSAIPPDRLANTIGMTETFGPHSGMPPSHVLDEHQRGASGAALGGIERKVVGLGGEELPVGAVGELWVRGGALMRGFYKCEREAVFTPDGFYATQDLARIESDGMLYFHGRTGDMLKTKGANVSRQEVEAALCRLPGVAEAVVCGLPDEALGQRIVAAVAPKPGATLEEAGLIATLKDTLSDYKAPRNIVIVDCADILWTASGKIRLKEMAALIAERLGLAGAP